MILDLDDERSLDAGRVGAKAAWLAQGRRAGLPILPGLVVEGRESTYHMRLGAETVARRGSGGARIAITGEPLAFGEELMARASGLGPNLVARSSSPLEAYGEWSGAFTSYLDLNLEELPRGVVGCWASAFSVATLERLERAGIEPGSVRVSVIVQSALQPVAGGTARLESDGTVTIIGTTGSPAPLLQGWVTGYEVRVSPESPATAGDELREILGETAITAIARIMRMAGQSVGATHSEWAVVDGEVWLLQLGASANTGNPPVEIPEAALDDPDLVRLARTVVQAPGPLGETWILPWALGGLPAELPISGVTPAEAATTATALSAQLAGEVWGLSPESALEAAGECFRTLRGPDPSSAVSQIRHLRPPDRKVAGRLLSLVGIVRTAMVELGAAPDTESAWSLTRTQVESVLEGSGRPIVTRVGVGHWEPFLASVVMANGRHQRGTPASPGIGAGLRRRIHGFRSSDSFRPREIATSSQPVPALAPLLWDAAGLVTATGSPAAHLFESARALGVAAVCGVDLPGEETEILAVDGHVGVVTSLPLRGGDDE